MPVPQEVLKLLTETDLLTELAISASWCRRRSLYFSSSVSPLIMVTSVISLNSEP
ncbi:MAG: hypothetical protein F6K31_39520 [Symploca sp. SIO2G7]|nr:hypothetical protein [Symploca sp. SIO2G7]